MPCQTAHNSQLITVRAPSVSEVVNQICRTICHLANARCSDSNELFGALTVMVSSGLTEYLHYLGLVCINNPILLLETWEIRIDVSNSYAIKFSILTFAGSF